MAKNLNARVQFKHDTAENWKKAKNFIPLDKELIVYDKDENNAHERFKLGDGVTNVNDLEFIDTSNHSIAICESAADSVDKIATINQDGFPLKDGVVITVRFTNGFQVANADATLNINNTGAYPISFNGVDGSYGSYDKDMYITWQDGILQFVFDSKKEQYTYIGTSHYVDIVHGSYGSSKKIAGLDEMADVINEVHDEVALKVNKTEADETYIPFSGGELNEGATLTLHSTTDDRKTEYTGSGFKYYAPSRSGAAWACTAGSYWDNADTTNYGGFGAYGVSPGGLQYYFVGAYNDQKMRISYPSGNTIVNGTFTPTKGMDASYLTWGTTTSNNIVGNTTIVDAPFIEGMSANRFAFKDPSTIIIEYSNDGGATWIDYGAADSLKQKLLTQSNSFYIGKLKPTTSASGRFATADDMLRVTIQKGNLYTNLKKLAIYVTTYGSSGCYVTIDQLLNGATEYTTLVNKQSISGWSGWNIINNIGNKVFGYTSISELRFTFGITTPPSSGSNSGALAINSIQGFGSIQYSSDTNAGSLPKTGLIYSYDMNKDVTFPATVTAVDFLGNLTGIASAARMDEEGNNIIDTYATKDALTNYVPLNEWDIYDENADTYFGGYSNMKELSDTVNYMQNGYLGRYKYYLGIDELADYSVPSAGWETSDMNHDWYFGGYTDMKELAKDVSYLNMGTWTMPNGREYLGVGDLFYAVSDLEEWNGAFFNSSDYVSISEISDEFTNIREEMTNPAQAQSHVLLTDTVTGAEYKVYVADGKLTMEVNE